MKRRQRRIVLAKVVALLGLFEFGLMCLFDLWQGTSTYLDNVLDAVLTMAILAPLLYRWIVREMDAREAMEERLRSSDARLRAIIDNTPSVIYIKDREGRYLLVDRRYEEVFGLSSAEVLGRTDYDLFPRETAEAFRANDLAVWESGQPLTREEQAPAEEGPRTYVSAKFLLKDSEGKPYALCGISTDITERKRMEDELRLLHAVTRTIGEASDYAGALRGVLRTLCEAAGWAVGEVWALSPDGRRLEFQAAWAREPGEFKDFLRRSAEVVFSMGRGLPGRVWLTKEPAWVPDVGEGPDSPRAGIARKAGLRGGFAVPVFDGERLVFVMDFFMREAMRRGDERMLGLVRTVALQLGSYILRRQAEDERERMRAQFLQSQKMEVVGLLASGIAHDFGNLLSAVIGSSELLLAELEAGDRRRSELETIHDASTRAAALIRRLLAFGRGQAVSIRDVDLNAVVADTEKMLRRLVGSDVSLSVRLAPGLAALRSDRGQLEQALVNLVVNARDAMPRGGCITIETADARLDGEEAAACGLRPGRYSMLAVADTGTGMEARVLARIFEPFFTTKPAGKGTGLGLPMVHGVVKQGGGGIAVDSRPGKGTVFRLYFPRAKAAARAPVQASPAAAQDLRAGKGETILLVEDDRVLRAVARHVLVRAGYVVLEARSGEDALSIARRGGTIDLAVLDLQLPDMSGSELGRALAGLRRGLRLAYTSGRFASGEGGGAPGGPEATLIPKPYTPDSLLRGVRQALDLAAIG